MGYPRFSSLSPINENDTAVINPIKRLAWGSILAGLLITSNMLPLKTPVMSMPLPLKTAALAVTIIGLLTALELAALTNKQFKITPAIHLHHFSNILGFFPAIVHRMPPAVTLTFGQTVANQAVDQTWIEKVGPKATQAINAHLISTTDAIQQGLVKTYLSLFLFTSAFAVLAIAY